MAVTLTSADSALKSVYLDVVTEQLNSNVNPFLAQINKTTDDVWGKEVKKLVTYGLNAGIGAGTEDGALPTAGENRYKQFVLPLKNLYGSLEISDKAIRASANSEGAFINLLNAEMEGLVKSSTMNFSRMLFGDGSGAIANITGSEGNIFRLDTLANVKVGMSIDIVDSENNVIAGYEGRKITLIDSELNEIVFSGETDEDVLRDASYIVMHGSLNNEITGLKKIFNIDAEELYGVNRASNKWINPTIINHSGSTFNELELQKLLDQVEEVSGSAPNFIVCSFGVRRAIQKAFQATNTRIDTVNLNGGYTAISYNGIPIVVDRYCPKNTIYALNTNDFAMYQLCDWQWLSDDDGRVLKQVPGKPVYTATLVKYAELLCSRPCGQGALYNVPEI